LSPNRISGYHCLILFLTAGDRILSKKAGIRLPIHPSVSEVLHEFLSLKGANNPLESYLLNDMIQVKPYIPSKLFAGLILSVSRA
jgi:hypothetical protein